MSRDINNLWQVVFVIAAIIFVIVQVGLLYSLWRYRARKGDDREPVQLHGNTRLEIMWTIIPVVILASIGVPIIKGIFRIHEIPTGPDVVQVKVTGHQWWWEFEYPDLTSDDGRTVVTANELHIPAGHKVNLTMTSADVIHSFWVPSLAGKRDLVPGRITHLTLDADEPTPPGEPLPGQCAEFCGLSHADMRFKVFVETDEGFQAWADAQLAPATVPTDAPATTGWEVFSTTCTACHRATLDQDGTVSVVGVERRIDVRGESFLASLAPDLTHFGTRTTFAGSIFTNTPEHVATWLTDPPAAKPMNPDRNDLTIPRVLGMPNFGLDASQIEGLTAMLESWK
jgi:cytochrome c oxidase subunit 2